MFGYGEVNQYNRHSTLMSAYKNIKDENFRYYIFKAKSRCIPCDEELFREESGEKWHNPF